MRLSQTIFANWRAAILSALKYTHGTSSSRNFDPEVRLTVQIGHLNGLDQPANGQQEAFVRTAPAQLGQVGVS